MIEIHPIDFLNNLQRFGWRLGLENITKLLQSLGNPHEKLAVVHVAGTNGKGTVAAVIASIYQAAGLKTGLYTSPHLVSMSERIKINRQPIPQEVLVDYVAASIPDIESLGCTYFETLTAVAFRYFLDQEVDVAVVEVGLGGRFDATNVVKPLASVITNIDLDHTQYLGSTTAAIAREKAGIIKPKTPCLTGCEDLTANRVLKEVADQSRSPISLLDEICSIRFDDLKEDLSVFSVLSANDTFDHFRLPLAGKHQVRNAVIAIQTTQILQDELAITRSDLFTGVAHASVRGRLEILHRNPWVLIDVAHNPSSIGKLIESITTLFDYERLIMVVGLLNDKDCSEIAKILSSVTDWFFVVTPDSDRALDGESLAKELKRYTDRYTVSSDVQDGFHGAYGLATSKDLVCVTGSHFVVGDFLNFYEKS